jgi:cytidine deaminase
MIETQTIFSAAAEARKHAHAPYSQFYVGAALVLDQAPSTIYTGCNIENISYGATICAERTAVVKALSEHPHSKIKALALVTDSPQVDCPCGMCLQVLSEFCESSTPIHLCNLKGVQKTVLFKELMPFQFESAQVKK